MESKLCFVQFLHPGGEAPVPPSGNVPWNTDNHGRKFLRTRGDYLPGIGTEPVRAAVLGVWGEWEAQTNASPLAQRVPGGPTWIHEPYYDSSVEGWRQNTDPFIFGEHFHYTGCRQHVKPKNARVRVPTQLAKLRRGSVIVFGSARSRQFIIDTVFVVGDEMIDHSSQNYERLLDGRISQAYREVTIDSWYSGQPPASQTHRLYFGATPERPIDGMFSFVPCARLGERPSGFARPRIEMGQVTQNKAMGFKLTILDSTRDAALLWRRVIEQVLDAGLAIGVRIELPPRRMATVAGKATKRTAC